MSKQNTRSLSKMRKAQKRAESIARKVIETGEVENDSEYEFDEYELVDTVYTIKDRMADATVFGEERIQLSRETKQALNQLMLALAKEFKS